MKIKQDLLRVTAGGVKADGTVGEPEEQTVQRVMLTDGEATTTDGKISGSMNTAVVVESQVSEFVRAVRSPCAGCKHFDNKSFLAFFEKADHPAAPIHVRESMNELRGILLQTYNAQVQSMHAGQDGDMDVEHAIRAMGYCRALTEIEKDYVVVHPLSTCPDGVVTPERPTGFFQPRDNEAERIGNKAYDAIMNRAAGK